MRSESNTNFNQECRKKRKTKLSILHYQLPIILQVFHILKKNLQNNEELIVDSW